MNMKKYINEENKELFENVYQSIYKYRLDMLLCNDLNKYIDMLINTDKAYLQFQIESGNELCLYELDKIITEHEGRKDTKKYQLWMYDDTTGEENYIIISGDTLQSVLDDRFVFIQCLEQYLQKRVENVFDGNYYDIINFNEKIGHESNPFVDERLNKTSKVIYSSIIVYDIQNYETSEVERHTIGLDVRELL